MRYTMREALAAAQHWLQEEAARPGEATPDEILRVIAAALDAPRSTISLALEEAEAFILGFEDDTSQEGVPALLSLLGLARRQEEQRPDLLAALHAVAALPDDRPGEKGGVKRARHIAKCTIATAEGRADG